ncbi:hypothetical protein [Paraburkholderia sp. MM6662-R1]|uniref:hypothetical protein n=1 Tax=Paraburkholderia sp. MM6662-R1 TaxID=2991066 RepID=UPI003D1E90F8
MQANQKPSLVTVPFAANGLRNTIPEESQAAETPGAASLNDGFPSTTMQPKTQGGIPPDGKDFNGILFLLSAIARWVQAGGSFTYDPAFESNANLGGYPKSAVLLRADGEGFWFNLADNNTTDPDAADGSARNWIALNADWNADSGPGMILNKPAFQAPLGFTPVEQGGGAGQADNKVHVGWRANGAGLSATVDSIDLGNFVFEEELNANVRNLQNNINGVHDDLQSQVNGKQPAGNYLTYDVGFATVGSLCVGSNSAANSLGSTVSGLIAYGAAGNTALPGTWRTLALTNPYEAFGSNSIQLFLAQRIA